MRLVAELLEFFVEEFVVVLVAAPEHHCANECAEEGENAQELLHEGSSVAVPLILAERTAVKVSIGRVATGGERWRSAQPSSTVN